MKHQKPAGAGSPQVFAKERTPAPAKAKANGKAARPKAAPSGDARDTFIRESAYAFYEARGRVDGHALEDWLQAEAEFDLALTGPRAAG
jgi:hypothetical protein